MHQGIPTEPSPQTAVSEMQEMFILRRIGRSCWREGGYDLHVSGKCSTRSDDDTLERYDHLDLHQSETLCDILA